MSAPIIKAARCRVCGKGIEPNARDRRCETHQRELWVVRSKAGVAAYETRARREPGKFVSNEYHSRFGRLAHVYVNEAVKHGLLPVLDGTIACVDCGDAASIYEHRDYAKPLDVEPCCHACNSQRGSARTPIQADFAHLHAERVTQDARRKGVGTARKKAA